MPKEIMMPENDLIVSKTDLKGVITYGNRLFIAMSGYEEKELLGAPHSILRHEDMPKVVFKLLWERIKEGREIFAFVKNRNKNDDYYWVYANVTPSFDRSRKIVGYHSVRRKPSRSAVEAIIPIYVDLLSTEKIYGVHEAERRLNELLKKSGVTYDQFVQSL